MEPFWKHFCQDVGSYGRNGGTFFLVTVFAGVCLLVGICVLKDVSGDHFPVAVGTAAFIAFAVVCRAFVRARRNRDRYLIQPLAREEIRRARSKLLGNQQARKL
jgi:hypothetical protein